MNNLFSSKVLYFNSLHLLRKIIRYEQFISGAGVYFFIGTPVLSPPSLRGNMVLELSESFLVDNKEKFVYGSPVDIGGLEFGLLGEAQDIDIIKRKSMCCYDDFFSFFVEVRAALVEEFPRIMRHQQSECSLGVVNKYFGNEVASFLRRYADPHAWAFEYKLQSDFILHADHVERLFFPNTYREISEIKMLLPILKEKMIEFNPKYGFDHVYF
ncbi:hypothetical protein [Candidatus Magnetaquicoccus inordinatus]|uniref:hypothetical protein n=1 Tax=Candidatus Magnetaquicoccus inordinatus TaxID=2496818 RepID=UPI00102D073D|nr:hypothetical protein [Candidatus Magnetaquicoccus inordinatus]